MGTHPERAPGPEEPPNKLTTEQEQLIQDIYPRIWRAVRRMTHDDHLTNDIAQDVCVKLILKFRYGDVIKQPMAFAMKVAKNEVKSHFTNARRHQVPSESIHEDYEDSAPWPYIRTEYNPIAGLQYLELLKHVRSAIGDELEASIWEMTHVWGLKGWEISESKGISPATVSRKLHRAEEKADRVRQDLEIE
ncbi:RNA polymerase sigma factor [Streptomyces chartreusis]|uniref:RNA polymerase sigma factor n=1 Tax=Streptomyces chartreusis TaxID=1969 RepID=UPI003651611C